MSYIDAMSYSPHAGSLPDKVLAFFKACPDEELTSIDIAEKFTVTPSGAVSAKMAPLVRMGLLASTRRGRLVHYSAGGRLAEWETGLAGTRAAPVATFTPAITLRPMGQPTQPTPFEIRINLQVHNLGTPMQRVEFMGIEP